MKIALIPPIAELHTFSPVCEMHMALAQLALESRTYGDFYRQERMNTDKHLILDNGAHESGSSVHFEDLMDIAVTTQPHELVVPDKPLDTAGTIASGRMFFEYITGVGKEKFIAAGEPRLMIVPQGKTLEAWIGCFHVLRGLHEAYMGAANHPTLAIAKNHDHTVRGGHVAICRWMSRAELRVEDVHMLGWPKDLWTLQDVAREFPWVRSVDSARPFVLANAGFQLDPQHDLVRGIPRAADYFTSPMSGKAVQTSWRNVEIFKAMSEASA